MESTERPGKTGLHRERPLNGVQMECSGAPATGSVIGLARHLSSEVNEPIRGVSQSGVLDVSSAEEW